MKKILFSILAVLLLAGTALAVSIPQSEDATAGPGVWTIQVYNNSGSTMDAGDVAVWDVGSSTGDNDNYVTTTTTADTLLVAGVVYPSDISAGDKGTIAIRGVVPVDASGFGLQTDNGMVCSSTTAGSAATCKDNSASFGIVTTAVSSSSINAYIRVK